MTAADDGRRRAVTATTVAGIVLVLFCVLALSVGTATAQSPGAENGTDEERIPSLSGWDDSLDWLSENTPEPGVSAEEYSVLSWWDYGDAISADGERPAVANFSQKNSRSVSAALLAQTEREALDAFSAEFDAQSEPRYVMVDALMAETASDARGKFFALADAYPGLNRSAFYRTMVTEEDEIVATVQTQAYYESLLTRLYSYHGSSKAPRPLVFSWRGGVYENDEGVGGVRAPRNLTDALRFEENLSAAQAAVAGDPSSQVGGIGPHPEEGIPALEQFRLVHLDEVSLLPGRFGGNTTATQAAIDSGLPRGPLASTLQRDIPLLDSAANNDEYRTQFEQLAFLYANTPSYTKTFERVPGATIEGTVDTNASTDANASIDEILLSVELDPENGRTFNYTQPVDVENNEFTATVPYATTGYDDVSVDEGYTNTSVRATGPYRAFASGGFDRNTSELITYEGTVNVSEAQVIGENPCQSTVDVEEQREQFDLGDDSDDSDDTGSESDGQATSDDDSGDIVTDCPERTSDGGTDDGGESDGDSETNGGSQNNETADGGSDGDNTTGGGDNESSSDGSGPGFGVGGALAGLGGAGYLLKRRLNGSPADEH